ncbi:elongation factor P 5-aminopentanone reductase [Clostridium grantii]|uniref:3-oxoacyl-[acyl-carrier protein] reductase n=1 Tax=Clostridium grantii DSM 8605 TaxID=1121316 RepID=A0A1M5UCQ1_9CLOT|nr:SDR family oxidoreductase [Clostridium grantii]SHH60606.1 3-oxoacyl-[acyl-carrier protein] reductase [Clostridium grantii DSM 8605]
MKLKGKVALITGGSRGIGAEIAKEFSKEGAFVVINYISNDRAAEETIEEIKAVGGYVIGIKADASDFNEAKNLVDSTIDKFGKLDILVNNAGISKVGLFIDMKEKHWDEMLNINLKSVFNLSNHVTKHMLANNGGAIINISSMWGGVGASCEVIYSASKGGIDAFTKALGKELAPNNIRVNAIAPGVIETDMNKWMNENEIDDLSNEIPMMRFGKPKEVAKLAVFLASEDSSYITAQVINVDGGMV